MVTHTCLNVGVLRKNQTNVISILAHHGPNRSKQAVGGLGVVPKLLQNVVAARGLQDAQKLTAPGQARHSPASETLTQPTTVLTDHVLRVLVEIRNGELSQGYGVCSNVTSHPDNLLTLPHSLDQVGNALCVEPSISVYSNSIVDRLNGCLLEEIRELGEKLGRHHCERGL